MTAAILLQASDDQLLALLQEPPPPPYEESAMRALLLLHHLHRDEAVQAACLSLVQPQLDAAKLEQARRTFAIFQSVLEYLPWMGDYASLQRDNIHYYQAHKAPYEALLMQSPVLVDRYLDLGRQLYLMFGLTEEAKQCLQDIEQYHPDIAEALYALGRISNHEGDLAQAAAYYERCLKQDPNHIYALLELGALHAQEEEYEQAIQLHQQVLEEEPFLTEAHVHLATSHHAIDDKARARQYLEAALGVNPHQEQALYWLGLWQWQDDNDIEAAMATFEKGVDHPIHGDSALLLAGLAHLYAKQLNEPNKARTYYEKSLRASPKQLETFRRYVQLLEEHYQDLGEMQAQYERYLELEPKDVTVYLDYADFLIKYLRDYHLAYAILEQAQARGVHHPALKQRLIDIEQQPGIIVGDNNVITQEALDELDDLLHSLEKNYDDDDDDDDFSGGGAAGDT